MMYKLLQLIHLCVRVRAKGNVELALRPTDLGHSLSLGTILILYLRIFNDLSSKRH